MVKEDEAADPVDVGLFGAEAEVFRACGTLDLVEELGRRHGECLVLRGKVEGRGYRVSRCRAWVGRSRHFRAPEGIERTNVHVADGVDAVYSTGMPLVAFPLTRLNGHPSIEAIVRPQLARPLMRNSYSTIVLFLLSACTSAVDVRPVSFVSDSLDTVTPANWEEITSSYPSCVVSSAPVGGVPLVEIPALKIALPLPAGAEPYDPGDIPDEMRLWNFASDSATLHVMRSGGIRGSANYMLMLEGAEMEDEGTCTHRISQHAALVHRIRFQLPEGCVLYGATMQVVPATGESLGGSVLAPHEDRREELLSVLLHLRVDQL